MDNTRPDKLYDEQQDRYEEEKLQLETEKSLHFGNIAPAMEFVCWVVVLLAPFLRWVNGPAVTNDQFVIQLTLFTVALLGGLGLRVYRIVSHYEDDNYE